MRSISVIHQNYNLCSLKVCICTLLGWQACCGVTWLTCTWFITQTHPFLPYVRTDRFITHLEVPWQRRGRCKASLTCSWEQPCWKSALHMEWLKGTEAAAFLLKHLLKPQFQMWDKCASLALLCNSVLGMISLVWLPMANKRNHTGCDAEAQGKHHTNKIHCRNQHLHWWAWCTAMCVVIFPLSILALLIFS